MSTELIDIETETESGKSPPRKPPTQVGTCEPEPKTPGKKGQKKGVKDAIS